MMNVTELKTVPDGELLRRLSDLLRQSRRVESVLIAHIAEVDVRRLYARDAGSMFTYCTQILHLSEHEAYARITAARASRKHPALLEMLGDGRLHLSGIGKLVPHLTDANCEDLLARATHKTKSEIEELVAEIAPKPDVPLAMRRLPVRGEVCAARELGPDRALTLLSAPAIPMPQLGPDRVAFDEPAPSTLAEFPSPVLVPAAVTPLSPVRYKVQFTATAELRDKLERLQALTREDLATAVESAVTERLERIESKRFGLTKSPRKGLDQTGAAPSSRYIPAPVRRVVRQRDGDQCTFVGQNGIRCTERRGLQFHHREPYGRGGTHSPDNVCVMCREHNAYLAERDYGKEWMQRCRRRPDHVSEGSPEYVLTPHRPARACHA